VTAARRGHPSPQARAPKQSRGLAMNRPDVPADQPQRGDETRVIDVAAPQQSGMTSNAAQIGKRRAAPPSPATRLVSKRSNRPPAIFGERRLAATRWPCARTPPERGSSRQSRLAPKRPRQRGATFPASRFSASSHLHLHVMPRAAPYPVSPAAGVARNRAAAAGRPPPRQRGFKPPTYPSPRRA